MYVHVHFVGISCFNTPLFTSSVAQPLFIIP